MGLKLLKSFYSKLNYKTTKTQGVTKAKKTSEGSWENVTGEKGIWKLQETKNDVDATFKVLSIGADRKARS